MPQLFLDPIMCGFQFIFKVLWSASDTKLYWSMGRTNCLHYSTRVDLYCLQILLSSVYFIVVQSCFLLYWEPYQDEGYSTMW